MGCCGKSRRLLINDPTKYLDNFKFLTPAQLAQKGKYKYCYKCEKYHSQAEWDLCNTEEGKPE